MGFGELVIGVEGFFSGGSRKDVSVFGSYKSSPLARLNVLEIQNNMGFAVNFKCNTFSKITCINHKFSTFLKFVFLIRV